MKKEYKIVTAPSIHTLEKAVQVFVDNGWQVEGGVSYVQGHHTSNGPSPYVQSVTKEKPAPVQPDSWYGRNKKFIKTSLYVAAIVLATFIANQVFNEELYKTSLAFAIVSIEAIILLAVFSSVNLKPQVK